ncbi:MAG: cobaltochelatase subunit CobN [Sandaracinaceae bacterium]|nr:cobaltochelatase subunit CobN [Sandaracinaceae bacterium]
MHAAALRLVGVVSEQNAPELLEGATIFARLHPEHELQLRTTEQLDQLTDAELRALLGDADAVLLCAVFGDTATRVGRALTQRSPRTVFALSSDAGLLRRSRDAGGLVFDGVADAVLHEATVGLGDSREPVADVARLTRAHPALGPWFEARAYWTARGAPNLAQLMVFVLGRAGAALRARPVQPVAPVRYLRGGREVEAAELGLVRGRPSVAVLDYDTGSRPGDAEVHAALCAHLERAELQCFSVLARWGAPSVAALEALPQLTRGAPLHALVLLQDFVVGGGEGRERATELLGRLDVPVIKGLRLPDRSEAAWRLSEDGLAWDSVHYRVAMPELQGAGQGVVVAAAGPVVADARTGLQLHQLQPIDEELRSLSARVQRWSRLRTLRNADKRIAVVYYNHPPGRHNIGADNLDVPATLFELLHTLKANGYDVGDALPRTQDELLQRILASGVNLPSDRGQLAELAATAQTVSAASYAATFGALPEAVQTAVTSGPLSLLLARVEGQHDPAERVLVEALVSRTLGDVQHLTEGARHRARDRAMRLLEQLGDAYAAALAGRGAWDDVRRLTRAIEATGIEGLRGWGPAPGRVMVSDGSLVIPGLRFGNVFMGPQPPRGWELDEELLHANLAFPPPHQYLAFYEYLRSEFRADVLVHVGRHSTYEFLPGPRVGLAATDFSRLCVGDLPSVYLYIVDGVGEGIQAKRRGLATIVDHLTPSLATSPLYDDLLGLRQLVESFEAAAGGEEGNAVRARAVLAMRARVTELGLREELSESMRGELEVRGIGFDQVDDELLVHEVGHYLTHLQEQFMPFGLHVFGRAWEAPAVDRMLASMAGDGRVDPAWRRALRASPDAERAALLTALEGRFVEPGSGNDPVRTPEVLPTGRNFHALDGAQLPTPTAWALGAELAAEARRDNPVPSGEGDAVILWASDTVRDEGAMVAFGLDLLGVRPVWNARGVLRSIERQPLSDGRMRRDVTFVTSGLFRDLYANLLVWLDRAVLLALDGSSATIRAQHPELSQALSAALLPLGELAAGGSEPLAQNLVAARWVVDAAASLADGQAPAVAGRTATLRLFGNAPGGYGAGINRLAERSGAFRERRELAAAYERRMGHAYGVDQQGAPAHAAFARRLASTRHTYLGRASNLYGLLDNNDGFDYLGGLSVAVEHASGHVPDGHVVQHASADEAHMEALPHALLTELRARHLNPTYLHALMNHGYAGARTMGSEFMENLWGWQVTNPDIVQSWVWDEVDRVYLRDGHELGLTEFLASGPNAHVKTNMLAIMLVAAQRAYWDAPPERVDAIAREFAALVLESGLPGSGHTKPDHPVMAFVRERLPEDTREAFDAALAAAQQPEVAASDNESPSTVREVSVDDGAAGEVSAPQAVMAGVGVLALAFLLGLRRGRRAR